MRVLILDDDGDRADAVETVLESALGSGDISYCPWPGEFATDPSFDVVVLHFRIEEMNSGKNAFAFLDGLFDETVSEPSLTVQKEYFGLGRRIRDASENPFALVYSGGGINKTYRDRLLDYGVRVCVLEGVGSHNLSHDFSLVLMRAFKGGHLDVDVLREQGTSFPYISALLILCEGWLIAHVDPATGMPTVDVPLPSAMYPEFFNAMERITGSNLSEIPGVLSTILPAVLMESDSLARIRDSVVRPNWWRPIATPKLNQLIGGEVDLEKVEEDARMRLLTMLHQLENNESIVDVELVASAYNSASSLIGDI